MGNNIRSSSRPKALAPSIPMPPLVDAMDAVHLSGDRFCLLAGVEALAEMMEEDATTVCGARHRRHGDRRGYRWGRTHSEIGYHGGKVKVARPRVRDRAGKEVSLESWHLNAVPAKKISELEDRIGMSIDHVRGQDKLEQPLRRMVLGFFLVQRRSPIGHMLLPRNSKR